MKLNIFKNLLNQNPIATEFENSSSLVNYIQSLPIFVSGNDYSAYKKSQNCVNQWGLEHDILFVDIDTKDITDEKSVFQFIMDYQQYVIYANKSTSGGFHIWLSIEPTLDDEEYQAVVKNFNQKINDTYSGFNCDNAMATKNRLLILHNVVDPNNKFPIYQDYPHQLHVDIEESAEISNQLSPKSIINSAYELSQDFVWNGKTDKLDEKYQKLDGGRLQLVTVMKNLNVSHDDILNLFTDKRNRLFEVKNILKQPYFPSAKSAINTLCNLGYISRKSKDYSFLNDYNKMILEPNEYLNDYYNEISGFLRNNNKMMLISPTGSGKTTLIESFANDPIEMSTKIVVAFPLNSVVESKLDGFAELNVSNKDGLNNRVKSVYDRLKYLNVKDFGENDLLFIDEIHMMLSNSSYRGDAVDIIYNFINNFSGRVVLMTGTNSFEEFLFDDFNKLSFGREVKCQNNHLEVIKTNSITETSCKKIEEVLNNGMKVLFCANISLKKQQAFVQLVQTACGLDDNEVVILRSEDKQIDSSSLNKLTFNKKLDDKIKLVVATSVIEVGIDILNDGKWITIAGEHIDDPDQVLQFGERFRKIDKNIVWIKNYGNGNDSFNENLVVNLLNTIRTSNLESNNELFAALYKCKIKYFNEERVIAARFSQEGYKVVFNEVEDNAKTSKDIIKKINKDRKMKEIELFNQIDFDKSYKITKIEGSEMLIDNENNEIKTRNTDKVYDYIKLGKFITRLETKDDFDWFMPELEADFDWKNKEDFIKEFKLAMQNADMSKMKAMRRDYNQMFTRGTYYVMDADNKDIQKLVTRWIIKRYNGTFNELNTDQMMIKLLEITKERDELVNQIKINNKAKKKGLVDTKFTEMEILEEQPVDLNGIVLKEYTKNKTTKSKFNYEQCWGFKNISEFLDSKVKIARVDGEVMEKKRSNNKRNGWEFDYKKQIIYRIVSF